MGVTWVGYDIDKGATVSTQTDFNDINDQTRQMFGSSFDALCSFADMLIAEGELRGLIGTKELPRLWSRHIVNSAALAQFLPQHPHTLADIGTGAGFPGVVLALMRPDVQVTLIESMERRCEWLEEVQQAIGIKNVTIIRDRCENIPRSKRFDVVTSRAVARLSKLVPLSAHLVRPGGQFLALKGERAQQEVYDARKVLNKAGLTTTTVHDVVSLMDGSITRVVEAIKFKS